ncbi:MAG: hypothetical protein WCQ91_07480, partial [Planctomycetota bacterium]
MTAINSINKSVPVSAANGSAEPQGKPSKPPFETDPTWYKDAIIYELHVKAFHDSNGDGIGDFPGLIE